MCARSPGKRREWEAGKGGRGEATGKMAAERKWEFIRKKNKKKVFFLLFRKKNKKGFFSYRKGEFKWSGVGSLQMAFCKTLNYFLNISSAWSE